MSEFCAPVNTTLLNSLLVNWILLISFVANHFHCINEPSSDSSESFRRHLVVYKPFTEYSSEMDFSDLKEDERRLSIVEPAVYYGKSTSPFYLTEQQHPIPLQIALHQPDHRFTYLTNLSQLSNSSSVQPSVQSLVFRQSSSLTENESQNEPAQFSERPSEGRSFFKALSDNLSQKISKSFSSIRSVYNASRRLASYEQSQNRKVDNPSSAPDKRGTLRRIVSGLGKLVSLPKRANHFNDEQTSDKTSDKTVDSNSKSNVNISFRPSSSANVRADSSSEVPDSPKKVGSKFAPFKETYKALFKTQLNPLFGGVSDLDRELNRIRSLASFVERNLRIIGLEPIYQLLSFNRTSSFEEDENLRKLVKQIDSKLVQAGEFNSLFSHFDSMRKTNGAQSSARSTNQKSSDTFSERAEEWNDNFGSEPTSKPTSKPTSERRSSEDDLSEFDLLLELEEYVRSKRSTTPIKQKTESDESERHENRISRMDEGGDQRIRREDDGRPDRPPAKKRVGLSKVKSKVKSRRRRSKKLGLKGRKNKKKSARSAKRLKSKIKKSSRKTSKKKKKSKNYNQSFPACDSSSESCKESEIHERFVPFTSEEDDDQQASESFSDQSNGGEFGGQHNEQSREGNEYSDQADQQDRSYEPATGNFKRDDEFRPEAGHLKSSVKYEGDQANQNYNQQNYYQQNYEGQSWDGGGGQSNYQSNYQQTDDAYKQNNEEEEYGHSLKTGYDGMFETGDGLSHTTASKSAVVPYMPPDYSFSYETNSWHAPAGSWHTPSSPPPHDTNSLLKALLHKKLGIKEPKSWPVYHPHPHHHHLEPHHPDSHYPEEDVHHYEHPPPPPSPEPHHEKDELTLVKELITNLLVENKHKILKIFKISKLSHIVVGKQFLAGILKILFGKGLIAKKHLIIVAYKKCYIKIKTVDLLLIPVGVGTLLTPLFLPLAPLALIIFGIIKLFTGVLCFLLAI